MKILPRTRRNEEQKDPESQLQVGKPSSRIVRAGFFNRFRRSSLLEKHGKKEGVCVSWKKYEELGVRSPSPSQCDEDSNANQGDEVSARSKMLRASSIATAEMSIPTDGSTGATASMESSVCQEGETSFLHETEASMETKEVLISTVDGQIETQRQEYILTDMHQVGAETHDQRLKVDEDNSVALIAYDEDKESEETDLISHLLSMSSESHCSDDSSLFSEDESRVDANGVKEGESMEENVDRDDDDSNPFEEDQDEEREEYNEEYMSDYEEDDEEEESLKDADKGVALLQFLFLDDDDESSYADDTSYDGGSTVISEGTFASALNAFEVFAAESIYSASVLFLGTPEPVQKRKTRKTTSLGDEGMMTHHHH
jgi:hypothetical protein